MGVLTLLVLLCVFSTKCILSTEADNPWDLHENFDKHEISKRDIGSTQCKDESRKCDKWADAGYCRLDKYKIYMDEHCRKTCGICVESCSDVKPKICKRWSKKGFCNKGKYAGYMMKHCKKTCDFCDTVTTEQAIITTTEQTTTAQFFETTAAQTTVATTTAELPTTEASTTVPTTTMETTVFSTSVADTTTTAEETTVDETTTFFETTPSFVETTFMKVHDKATESLHTTAQTNEYYTTGNVHDKETTEDQEQGGDTTTALPEATTEVNNQSTTDENQTTVGATKITDHSTNAFHVSQMTTESMVSTQSISTVCDDDLTTCEYLKEYCDKSDFIQNSCKKTCGVCTSLASDGTHETVVEIAETTPEAPKATTAYDQTTNATELTYTTPLPTVPTTAIPCVNTLAVCTQYNKSACKLSDTLNEFCPVLCERCVPEPKETSTFAATLATTLAFIESTTTPPQIKQCEDVSSTCSQYKMHCSLPDMIERCPETCGRCKTVKDYKYKPITTTPSTCKDLDSNVCGILVGYCTGAKLSEKIRAQCAKTCGMCKSGPIPTEPTVTESPVATITNEVTPTVPTVCADLYDNCDKLTNYCESVPQMKDTCPRTCGLCKGESNPPALTPDVEDAIKNIGEDKGDCQDTFAYCKDIADRCFDDATKDSLETTCRKTCGYCKKKVAMTWTEWSECSSTCGEGVQKRQQICGDENCDESAITQSRSCQLITCDEGIDGDKDACKNIMSDERCQKFSDVSECGTPQISYLCQKSCGLCTPGQATTIKPTTVVTPSINGEFTEWSDWTECSLSCGGGIQQRKRGCMHPSPRANSVMCEGASLEERKCNVGNCGETTTVVTTTDKPEEAECKDLNKDCQVWAASGFCQRTYAAYMIQNCPVSCRTCGVWNQWQEWGECSKTCNSGVQERQRNCISVGCIGLTKVTQPCNTQQCGIPVCKDISKSCARLPELDKCGDPKWIVLCRKSCGKCGNSIGSIDKESSACMDTNEACPKAAAKGLCRDPRVVEKCPSSCGQCTKLVKPMDGCIDKFPQCASLANAELCRQPSIMSACAKTCMACPGSVIKATDACVDTSTSCAFFKSMSALNACDNERLSSGCKKTCGKCKKDNEQVIEVEITEDCKDSTDSCKKLTSICHKNPAIKNICKESCGFCRKPTEEERKQTEQKNKDPQCFDKRDDCGVFKTAGYCLEDWVKKLCHKSCGECFANEPEEKEDTNQYIPDENQLPSFETSLSPCLDISDDCTRQTEMDCRNNPYINFVCGATCGSCSSSGDTLQTSSRCMSSRMDNIPSCENYKSLCGVATIREMCATTCDCLQEEDKEGKSSDEIMGCRNFMTICDKNSDLCDNPKTSSYARTMCPLTCNSCGENSNVGSWESWGTWTQCSATCNGGKRLRTRACPHRRECDGQDYQEGECNKDPCSGIENIRPSCKDQLSDCREKAEMGRCQDLVYRSEMQLKCMQTCLSYVRYDEKMVENCISQWKPWSTWTECSATCGLGTHKRTRKCEIEGKCEGSDSELSSCNLGDCQQWLNWEEWSECSVTCGQGKQHRLRKCRVEGQCDGSSGEMKVCHKPTCGYWAKWSVWSKCSTTCGDGVIQRTRKCIGGDVGDGECVGDDVMSMNCSSNLPCPVWGEWEAVDDCSTSCGGGIQTFERECVNVSEFVTCNDGPSNRTQVCNTQSCFEWTEWGEWSNCSAACSVGIQTRERDCIGGDECIGENKETQQCGPTDQCGSWMEWGQWSSCSVTCDGEGEQVRKRMCEEDMICEGKGAEIRQCYVFNTCAYWDKWSELSECSATCGEGVKSRSRKCIGGKPGNSGCSGDDKEDVPCMQLPCFDIKSTWTAWVDASECSASCGKGTITRTRSCLNGLPGHGGCAGDWRDVQDCELGPCVDGKWGEWSVWSQCSTSCGSGIERRTRVCVGGIPSEGGCQGDEEETRECTQDSCPHWGSWERWSRCTKTCGTGGATRTRPCVGGQSTAECGNQSEAVEVAPCNKNECPRWSEWSDWGGCSVSCGEGHMTRSRDCMNSVGEFDECIGERKQLVECNLMECDMLASPRTIDCYSPINLGTLYPNSSFNASYALPSYEPYNAKMSVDHAWCTPYTDSWIQVDLGWAEEVAGITMKGYSGAANVETFTISSLMSPGVGTYVDVKDENNNIVNYEGPSNASEPITRYWNPTNAQIWRINLLNTIPGITCLQFDLLTTCNQDLGSGGGLL